MINRKDYIPIQTGGTTSPASVDLKKLQIDPAFISLGENGIAKDRNCTLNLSYARLKAEYNELGKDNKVKADVKGANLNLPPEPKEIPKTIRVTKSR